MLCSSFFAKCRLLAIPLVGAMFLSGPVQAASFALPDSITFAGQSYSEVYLNEVNGTLSFGNEYVASGPNVTGFLNAPGVNGVTGLLAAGFGDYEVGSAWTTSALANGTLFSFSGVDTVTGVTNAFSVALFDNSTVQFSWNTVEPNSFLFGIAAVGISPAVTYEPFIGDPNLGIDPSNPFFYYDCSLDPNGCQFNGQSSPVINIAVPEPGSAAATVALASAAVALGRRRRSRDAAARRQ